MKRAAGPLSRRLVMVALGTIAVAGFAVGGSGLLHVWRMQRELATLEQEIVRLRAQTQTLARTVDRLRHDPAYIEQVAREDLGLVREGERVLKFPSQPR